LCTSTTLSYRQVRSVTVRYAQLPSGSVTGYSAITDRHRRHPWVIRQNFLDRSIEGSDRDFFEIFLRVIEEAPTFSHLFKIYLPLVRCQSRLISIPVAPSGDC